MRSQVRSFLLLLALPLMLGGCGDPLPTAGLHAELPDAPNRASRYLFLLGPPGDPMTQPGQALADRGLLVVAPTEGGRGISRPVRVRHWIRELLALGVPADRLAVVGFGLGGDEALEISALVKMGDLSFVLIGTCALGDAQREEQFQSLIETLGTSLRGRLLSLRAETGAQSGSCAALFERSPFAETWESSYAETDWLTPLLDWIGLKETPSKP
ncbi:hypothetical protein JCM17960_18090 [Magnetospira thiophila]